MLSPEQIGVFNAPVDRTGGLPSGLKGLEEPHQNLASEGGKLTEGDNLSPDAYWTLDFMYNLGHTMYIEDRAEYRGFDLKAGMEELRQKGILDETDTERPKVRKEQLHEDFRKKLEQIPFIEREERESGSKLAWGERLTKDGFWVFDYLQGIGPTRNLRKLAQEEGIDYDAGLAELRDQGILDESKSGYPEVKLD